MTTLRRKSGAIFTFCFCAFRKLEASTFVPEWSADNGVLTSCAVAATAFTYASAFVCKCRACSRSRFRCFRDSTAISDASCKSDKTNSEKGSETGSEEGSEKECDANSEIDSETGSEIDSDTNSETDSDIVIECEAGSASNSEIDSEIVVT